ncbi:MAG: FecCD family ABC transporter permease [Candidatus Altarchaeaceae archaeon]
MKKMETKENNKNKIDHIARKKAKYASILTILIFGVIIVILLGIMIGSVQIHPLTTLKIFIEKFLGIFGIQYESGATQTEETIVLEVRGPRVIMGIIVGAALAIAGAAMQGLFRNPMAEPYVLGMSSGAAVGAALAIVLGISFLGFGIVGMAFVFALLEITIVYFIARTHGKIPVETLLLAGIAMGFFMYAIVSFLKFIAPDETLKVIVLWLMGSLSGATWSKIPIVLPILIIGTIGIYMLSRELNAMQFGEETASYVGVNVETTKRLLLIFSSIITATAVAFSGIIGFVGLIIPHIIRMIAGPDHHILLPASALFGGIFLVLCDIIARAAFSPVELPIGIVTAFIGAPYFIYLLRKKKKGFF